MPDRLAERLWSAAQIRPMRSPGRVRSIERLLSMLEVRLNAVGLCQVADRTRLDLPAKDDVLIHFVLKGHGTIAVADGDPIALRPGMLVFVPPGMDQQLSGAGRAVKIVSWRTAGHPFADGMVKLETDPGDALVSACGLVGADCAGLELFDGLREAVAEDVSAYPEMLSAFELIAREFERPRLGTRALAEALMKQALVIAMREQLERGDFRILPLAVADSRLLKALTFMLEKPAAEHDLRSLASITGMSRSLFVERFTATFGAPPGHLLKQIRLHRASDLLRNTDLPVQVISLAVGYAGRSYFSRSFKTMFGHGPKSYRQRARVADRQQPSLENSSAKQTVRRSGDREVALAHCTAAPKFPALA